MSDATPNPTPQGTLPVGIQRASAAVVTDGLDPKLFAALTPLGLVHLHLFDVPLTITSARDAIHGKGSKHYTGHAVDVRVKDLRPEWQSVFLLVVTVICDRFGLTVFDERNLPGESHFHIETAG